MGGGAPLAFLNKKTWHPGRMQNLEEVWKREQAAAAEQRKLEELRKQYEDERKNSELTQIAEEAGYKRDARLDWMYAGSLAAKHAADTAAAGHHHQQQQQQQEAPLSKAPAADENLSRAERAVQLPSFMATDTPAGQNEAWARLNNDPLLAIKKQEQDALKRVRENPIKMQQILKEVEKVRKDKKEKKSKKEKKDKKEKKHHRHSSSSPDSRDRHPAAAAAPGAGGLKRGRPRSESPGPYRSRPTAAAAAAARESGPVDWVNRGRQDDSYADRDYRPAAATAATDRDRDSRGRYLQPGHQQQQQWRQQQGRDSSRERAAKRNRSSRSRSRDHRHDRSDYQQQQQQQLRRDHDGPGHHQGFDHGNGNGVIGRGADTRSRDSPVDRDHSKDRHGADLSQHRPAAGIRDHNRDDRADFRHDSGSRHQPLDHDRHDRADNERHKISSSSKDGRYGLELAGGRHSSRGVDMQQMTAAAEARAAATRQRLAEAEAAQAEAAAAAAAAAKVRQRQEYKTGKLSAEQKAARLAEMMGNAQQHEQQRRERLEQARAAEDSERGVTGLLAKAAAAQAEDAFKSAAAAEVFGSLAGGGMSLDARISSRRHYQER